MGCHIGRHRAHEQRVNLGVRFERLSPVGEEAQQPGIKPFVGGNIDAGAAARDNEGENMQFLLALSKPALFQQLEIQLIGKDKMFQLLLGGKKQPVFAPRRRHVRAKNWAALRRPSKPRDREKYPIWSTL